MSDTTWVGDGYSIEWLGIQRRLQASIAPTPYFPVPAEVPNIPTAQVTITKSGDVTLIQWPWGWVPVASAGDDGFQDTMFMAKSFADK
jgi:hypothetical protein